MLFVGYPISFETACGFLCLPPDVSHETFDALFAVTGLDLHYVDKGQCILGLQVYTGDLFDSFVSVDDSIIYILERKKKVSELIAKAGIDLSDFMLQPIGHEPTQRVFNPPPYLINC